MNKYKQEILDKWSSTFYFSDYLSQDEVREDLNNFINEIAQECKIVIYKDGSYKIVEDGITWEYENDEDWLSSINLINIINKVN